jgi:RimJ/RimL family protein N-acetyltransferase
MWARAIFSPIFQVNSQVMMNTIPLLETPRLSLREHRREDFLACVAMWTDPQVVRHTILTPSTPQRTWMRMMSYLGHWKMMGYGYWAVEEKATGQYIGELGFADFKREMVPSIEGIPELGWALVSSAHGKGYATEALRAVTAWGDKTFDEPKTVCIIHPTNLASIRVAEKCGYTEVLRTTHMNEPTILFARPRSDSNKF